MEMETNKADCLPVIARQVKIRLRIIERNIYFLKNVKAKSEDTLRLQTLSTFC